MKREATQTIWRTVVIASAMLGAPACSKPKPAATTPSNAAKMDAETKSSTDTTTAKPDTTTQSPTPPADPCAGTERPRGTDDDGGGGMGRGFVLS
jgi:hypothetical protein